MGRSLLHVVAVRSLPLLLLAASFAGCSDDGSPTGLESLRLDLMEARALWDDQGISDYTYVLAFTCFCDPDLLRRVVISVTGVGVQSVIYEDTEEPVPADLLANYPSIDGLFDELESFIDQGPSSMTVEFSPENGMPTQADIDFDDGADDDELGITASNLIDREVIQS